MSKHWQNSAKKQFSIPKFKGKFWNISLIWKFSLLAVLKSKIMWALVFFFWDAYYLVPASLCFRVVISSKLQRKKNQTKKHTINRVFACMHEVSGSCHSITCFFFILAHTLLRKSTFEIFLTVFNSKYYSLPEVGFVNVHSRDMVESKRISIDILSPSQDITSFNLYLFLILYDIARWSSPMHNARSNQKGIRCSKNWVILWVLKIY